MCIFIFQDYRRFIGKIILSIHFNVRFYNQNKKVPEIRGLFEVILVEGIVLLFGQGVAVFNGADVADEGVTHFINQICMNLKINETQSKIINYF